MPRGSTSKITDRAPLIERLAEGAPYDVVAAEYRVCRATIANYWCHDASAEQRARRLRTAKRPAYSFRQTPILGQVIERGLRGDAWPAIGAALFPQKTRGAGITAAQTLFHANATPQQRETRRVSLAARKFNQLPRLGATAEWRRRYLDCDDRLALPERADPFVGLGACFA